MLQVPTNIGMPTQMNVTTVSYSQVYLPPPGEREVNLKSPTTLANTYIHMYMHTYI